MARDGDDAESGLLDHPRSAALLVERLPAIETSACWAQGPASVHSYVPLPLPRGGWRPPRRAVLVASAASLLLLGVAAASVAWHGRRPHGVGVPARGRGELQGKAFAWPDAQPEPGDPSAEPDSTFGEAEPEFVRPPFTRAAEEGSPPWATASAEPWPVDASVQGQADATAGAVQYGGFAAEAQSPEAGYATFGDGADAYEPAAEYTRGAAGDDPRGVYVMSLSQEPLESPQMSTLTFTETATSTSTTTLPATTTTRTTTTFTTGSQARTTTSTKATTITLTKDVNAPLWVLPKWAQASVDGVGGTLPTLGDLETAETTTVRTTGATEASHTHVASTSVRLAGSAHGRHRPQASTARPHRADAARTSHGLRKAVVTTTKRHHRPIRPTPRPPTLYCWSVMVDRGYEMGLMMVQIAKGVSIFSCDDYTVLSNSSFKLTPLLVTENIGDLNCDYGGPFYLALNSEIFARAWSRIFAVGRYKQSDWTVKIDPDAVFLPSRLRQMLKGADPHSSVYFNNCDEGLHGPLEVISRGGMVAFDRGMTKCVKELSYEWDWAGEDVFLRHCLGLLNVSRVDNFQLLSEDHCFHENPARNGCWSGKVAFHPFKTTDGYYKCLWEAEHTGMDGSGRESRNQLRAS